MDEAFGVKGPGGLKGPLTLFQHAVSSMMMDIIWGEHRDPGMAVLGVVPGEERPAEGDGGGDVFEAPREAGVILQGLELRFGAGIVDPAVLLTFGESDWKAGIAEAEDPAGFGLLALARRGCTLRWRLPGGDPSPGYRLVLEPAHFLGRDAAHVVPDDSAPWPHGTAVTFEASEAPHAVRTFLETAARHYPLAVTIDGKTVERRAFLDGALHAEPWKGLVFGVFKDSHAGYRVPDVNFHGLTLPVRLPQIDAETADLPAPMVRAAARLHRHRAAWLRSHKVQQLRPAQLLAERNRPIRPRTVQLKAVLRQIDPDHVNLFHGRPLPRLALTTPPTWHIAMPSGGASTPSVTDKPCGDNAGCKGANRVEAQYR